MYVGERCDGWCLERVDVLMMWLFARTADGARFWWFEVWDLCRKLLLNCVVSLLAKTGANRIIAGLIVL